MTATVDRVEGRQPLLDWAWSLVRLDFVGIVFGALFFCASLTPSLLPRDWLFAGIVGGLNAAVGYGVGVVIGKLFRRMVLRERSWWPPSRAVLWWLKALTVVGSIALCTAMVVPAAAWQRQVSALMGIAGPATLGYYRALVVAVLFGAAVVAVSRVVLDAIRLLARILIRRWHVNDEVALFIGTAVVVVLILTLVNGVLFRGFLAGASRVFQPQNTTTRAGLEQPTDPERSGSPASFARWDTLGYQGRNFVATGPDAGELTRLNGRPAKEPIRVYAGLQSAATDLGRLSILMTELERTHAFDRKVLAIVPTTGTGWVNPIAARSLELMYNGDTAIVALQYSYLPSWISFAGDVEKSADSGRMLINAVHDRMERLPDDRRPKLLLYGESLGSLAGQAAFGYLPDISRMGFDSVLWVGPPNASTLWRALIERRDPGSTEVAPRYDAGRTVRFSEGGSAAEIQRDTAAPWLGTRVLFLQHPSDPIVWWSSDLLFSRPDWLSEPPGRDRSPAMRWYPFVTFSQVGVDVLKAVEMPDGHGHNYGSDVLDGWVAVAPPDGWTSADTERVRAALADTIHEDGPLS